MNAQARVAIEAPSWASRNQQWLVAEFARLRMRIENPQTDTTPAQNEDFDDSFVPALERCTELFGLSRFECDVLLLCAGVALDTALARAVAEITGHADGAPTFSFALSLLDEPHWDALSPQAPLRYWRLITAEGSSLARAPLRVDERVLHYLTGVDAIDERLDGIAELVPSPRPLSAIPDWVRRAVAAFASGHTCVHLEQPGGMPSREQVMPLFAAIGCPSLWLTDLPEEPASLSHTLRLIDRETALTSALAVLDLRRGHAPNDASLPERMQAQLHSTLLLLGSHAAAASSSELRTHRIALPAWTPVMQTVELIQRSRHIGSPLDDESLQAAIAEACEQFVLSQPRDLDEVARAIAEAGDEVADATQQAWQSLREHSRGGLDALAERIDSATRTGDVVLPNAQQNLLRDLTRQLQHRRRVYRDWGFAGRGTRGLGMAALFAGESGTGKTMAAEAIANGAGLDLYRIDLASTVSKYIGETEKNLKKIFDAAEASGAVLLFDEADALFGKRSEVKDSHDRYANIETAYLLQRIEAYRGLAILTTNMRGALDRAFLRRIRFVVQFPYPDAAAREQIWRSQFGPMAPVESLDYAALAGLHLTGGNIRSVAINAAFKAAATTGRISQDIVIDAVRTELAKLERAVNPRSIAEAS